MAITSSVVTVGHAQIDGRRWVREVHSDAQGVAQIVDYLGASDAATTAQGIANARVAGLNESLADAEVEAIINGSTTAAFTFRFLTGMTDFCNRLRAKYAVATGDRACMISEWVAGQLNAGHITVLDMRTAFGMTVQQFNSLKSTMDVQKGNRVGVRNAVGA